MTLPETIWAHAMHEALMEGRELCAMPRYLWKHAPDVSMRLEPGGMRGFDLERDLPHDPDGLDDVDPEIYRMLNPSRLPNVMVLAKDDAERLRPNRGLKTGEIIVLVGVPRPDSSSWARELFMREGAVLTESPPCAFAFGDGVLSQGGEEIGTVTNITMKWDDDGLSSQYLLRKAQAEMMKNAPRCVSCGVNTYLMGCFCSTEANREHPCGPPYDALLKDGRVLEMKTVVDESFHLKDIFIASEPPPPGVRYGPYDADPHTKGRRRRFRTQRRT